MRTSTRSSRRARRRAEGRREESRGEEVLGSIAVETVDELVRPHQAELPPRQALEVEVVAMQPADLVPQARVALHEDEGRLPERSPLGAQAGPVRDPVLSEEDRGGDARDREPERPAQHLSAPDAHRAEW